MNYHQARTLWNDVCWKNMGIAEDGTSSEQLTAFGGISVYLIAQAYLPHWTIEDRAKREMAAKFLREWADAIEQGEK